MSETHKPRLADAIPHGEPHEPGGHGGKPHPTHETAAEQAREAQEKLQAENDQASNREKMVDIGRGNQQAGRQGQ